MVLKVYMWRQESTSALQSVYDTEFYKKIDYVGFQGIGTQYILNKITTK